MRLSPGSSVVGAQAAHVIVFAHFGAGDYAASETAARAMLERYPEYLPAHYVLIAAAAVRGRVNVAATALADLLHLQPDFSLTYVRDVMPWTGDIGERLLQGWRLAGAPEE